MFCSLCKQFCVINKDKYILDNGVMISISIGREV